MRHFRHGDLRLGEETVVHLRVERDLLDEQLVRASRADDSRLQRMRHDEATFLPVVAIEDGDVVHLAVELARIAVDLHFKEAGRIDPYAA